MLLAATMDALSNVYLNPSASDARAGLRAAQEQMTRASRVIAEPDSAASVVTLSAAAVALKSASAAFEAGVQVIQAQDESLGSLIDTLA